MKLSLNKTDSALFEFENFSPSLESSLGSLFMNAHIAIIVERFLGGAAGHGSQSCGLILLTSKSHCRDLATAHVV